MNLPIRSTLKLAACLALTISITSNASRVSASESEVRVAQSDLPTPVHVRKSVPAPAQEMPMRKPVATVGGVVQETAERQNFSNPQWAQIAVSNLHVRSGPAATFDSITVLQKDNQVRAFAKVGSWLEVEWPANLPAYVNDDYVKADGTVSGERVRIRSGGNMNAAILTEAKRGDKLKILGKAGEWYKIEAPSSARGYISAKYASLNSSATEAAPVAAKVVTPKTPDVAKSTVKKPDGVTVFVETVTLPHPEMEPPLPETADAHASIAAAPMKSVEITPTKKIETPKVVETAKPQVAPAITAVAVAKPIVMPKITMPPIPPAKPEEKVVQAAPAPATALPANVQMPKITMPEIPPVASAPKVEVAIVKPVETQKHAVKLETAEVVKVPAKLVVEPQVAKAEPAKPVVAPEIAKVEPAKAVVTPEVAKVESAKPAPVNVAVVEKKNEVPQDKWGIYLPPPKGFSDQMTPAPAAAPARSMSQVEAPAKIAPVDVSVQPAPSKVIVVTKPVQLDKATLELIRAKWSPDTLEPAERKISSEQAELAKIFPKHPATPAPKAFRVEPERNSSLVNGPMTYGYQPQQDTPSFQ